MSVRHICLTRASHRQIQGLSLSTNDLNSFDRISVCRSNVENHSNGMWRVGLFLVARGAWRVARVRDCF